MKAETERKDRGEMEKMSENWLTLFFVFLAEKMFKVWTVLSRIYPQTPANKLSLLTKPSPQKLLINLKHVLKNFFFFDKHVLFWII